MRDRRHGQAALAASALKSRSMERNAGSLEREGVWLQGVERERERGVCGDCGRFVLQGGPAQSQAAVCLCVCGCRARPSLSAVMAE